MRRLSCGCVALRRKRQLIRRTLTEHQLWLVYRRDGEERLIFDQGRISADLVSYLPPAEPTLSNKYYNT
jgi:hypothetical protein